ncbi:DUF4062 domain-containing protein [Aeromonas caviae]|uniref:DUF4062 domain-containing protein n=1 Tax=Aeromonas caviae TaxID=648 RepID=UPI003F743287
MSSKFQVFVSSTYIDLKEQRDQVIKAILEMGHIPVGMEMFSAADEEQWGIIRRQIDQSDYYVVILANRYGSVTDEGISYTEKEYDYAVSQGVPTLGFVLDDSSPWPSQYTDTSATAVSALDNFKNKVKLKHVSFWKNTDDLYGRCSIALSKAFTAYPREGWIRASQYTDTKLTGELARLSAENATLREKLESFSTKEKQDRTQEFEEDIQIISKNKRKMHVWLKDAKEWKEMESASLQRIFLTLAPEMLIDMSIQQMATYIAQMFFSLQPKDFRTEWPMPSNSVKDWMADFSVLGLVKPSEKKKPVSDKDEYWTLTEKGKELLRVVRRRILKLGATETNAERSNETSNTETKTA